jgi:uncharacterized protein YfaP (DUF2135 family)
MAVWMRSLFLHVARLWRPAFSLVVLASLSACIEWKQPTAVEETSIVRYVSSVQSVDGTGTTALRTGAPAAASGGPVVTAPIPQLVLLGGTIQVTASATTPFTKVRVVVPDVNDYWELTLPAATTSAQILIVFSQDIPKTQFAMQLSGANGSGSFGTEQSNLVSVISVGTGDVQVNVTWDSKADVDLHVVDPAGGEAYWAGRTTATGGQLDLDSNAGCSTDGPRAENIYWASGIIAPKGEYVVRVDHWSACSAVRTNYVVTVNVRGKPPQVFSGVFTGQGDAGGKGSGITITRFTY